MSLTLNMLQGGTGVRTPPLAPEDVYRLTRPADWLELPEPQSGEIYLLLHIPAEGSALCAFTLEYTGSCTVTRGTAANGVFIPGSSQTPVSGSVWEGEFDGGDYGSETAEGMRQAVIKVSAAGLTGWAPAAHSSRAQSCNWNIVEIRCAPPEGAQLTCGAQAANGALCSLRYFSWEGGTGAGGCANMFRLCSSLLAVLGLDTAGVQDLSGMFMNCSSLLAVPAMDVSDAENVSSMFMGCSALPAPPALDISSAVNVSGMFRNCYSLVSAEGIQPGAATNAQYMFADCRSLRRVGAMDFSQAANLGSLFSNCYAMKAAGPLKIGEPGSMSFMFGQCTGLGELTFDAQSTDWAGTALSLSSCALGHAALLELIDSLPQISGGAQLALGGNPGAAELTATEIAAAEARGWTVTV